MSNKANFPYRIWLQWHDDDGNLLDSEERTYCAERVNKHDACYIRAGKSIVIPEAQELERLQRQLKTQGETVMHLWKLLYDQGIEVELIKRDGIAIGLKQYTQEATDN